jgi:hypothetical protein
MSTADQEGFAAPLHCLHLSQVYLSQAFEEFRNWWVAEWMQALHFVELHECIRTPLPQRERQKETLSIFPR